MTKKRVVVTCADTKCYVGELEDTEIPNLSDVVPLLNAYQLLIVDQHVMGPDGRAQGMSRSYMLMNVGAAPGALPGMAVKPTTWFFPEEVGLGDVFDALIKQFEDQMKPKSTGPRIVPAGPGAIPMLDKIPGMRETFKGR